MLKPVGSSQMEGRRPEEAAMAERNSKRNGEGSKLFSYHAAAVYEDEMSVSEFFPAITVRRNVETRFYCSCLEREFLSW